MQYRLVAPVFLQEDIKKSKFLVYASPIQNEADVFTFFEQHRQLAATHHCWAFKIGLNYRFNDDGEPSGTAGKPILSAIETQHCDEVAVLVIRYFGGVKLGTGGLIRAYGGCANRCLKQAQFEPIILRKLFRTSCVYSQWAIIENEIKQKQAIIESLDFSSFSVNIILSLTAEQAFDLALLIKNVTKGQSELNEL